MDAVSTRLRLRVSPGATRADVVGRYGQAWKVRVAAPPEDGRANDAVVRLLAHALSQPVRQVHIVAGHTSPNKVVEVHGLSREAVHAVLGAEGSRGGVQ